MRPPITMALWLPFCAMLLSGCATALFEPPASPPALRPPAALTECAARPPTPGPEATQRGVALFLFALDAAHSDCRSKLAALAALYDAP